MHTDIEALGLSKEAVDKHCVHTDAAVFSPPPLRHGLDRAQPDYLADYRYHFAEFRLLPHLLLLRPRPRWRG